MGSHAVCAGAWASGPGDVAPDEYRWGYNRMTTVSGLFGAGDTIGGSAHKFSSGSYCEGRLAAKAAVAYVRDHPDPPRVREADVAALHHRVFAPLENWTSKGGGVTAGTVHPDLLFPNQGLNRLEKIMDEYGGGVSANYATNRNLLERGLAHLAALRADLTHLGARDLHQLLRSWELDHRLWTAEAVLRHTLFREETRWPGYYYRADFPHVDDERWKCFVNSVYSPATGEWRLFTRPYRPSSRPGPSARPLGKVERWAAGRSEFVRTRPRSWGSRRPLCSRCSTRSTKHSGGAPGPSWWRFPPTVRCR